MTTTTRKEGTTMKLDTMTPAQLDQAALAVRDYQVTTPGRKRTAAIIQLDGQPAELLSVKGIGARARGELDARMIELASRIGQLRTPKPARRTKPCSGRGQAPSRPSDGGTGTRPVRMAGAQVLALFGVCPACSADVALRDGLIGPHKAAKATA